MRKVAIIGAGAAGMTAAITAASNGAEVVVLEHMDRVGKKILSTGAYDADINEPASYKVLSEKNSQQINATSPEDVQWLKFVVLEDGKYKLSYKEENNA